MRASGVIFILLLYLGYLGYQAYDFFNSETAPLAMANQALEASRATLAQKEKKVKDSQEFYRTLDQKRAALQQLSEKLLTMKGNLSESLDIPAFMKLLITEAQRIGLQITSITPAARTKQTYYAEQPIDINFNGVFIQLIAYLDRLSQTARIIRVEDIKIHPTSSATTKNKSGRFVEMTGSIQVKTFFYLVTRDDELGKGGGAE